MRGGRGGGRGGPMPGGRGGGPMRSPPGGGRGGSYPNRGGGYGPGPQGPPGPGRGYPPNRGGRPGPPERAGVSDPTCKYLPPVNGPGPGGPDQGFGGSGPFPSFPGAQRRNDMMDDQQLAAQMGGMDISGQRPGPGPRGPIGPAPNRGPGRGGYGGPAPNGPPRGPPQQFPPQDYPDQRGPRPGRGGYGPDNGGYPDEGFGPPARSVTMPVDQMGMQHPGSLVRRDSAPHNAPMGRGMPPRPNTAQNMRGPPQRGYGPNGPPGPPPSQDPYMDQGYGGPPDSGYGGQQRPASFDDFYDYYNAGNGGSGEYPPNNMPPGQQDMPNFDAIAAQPSRSSFDQHMQVGSNEQAQRGAMRVPEMNRTKSQPDLRNSQTAVFEMAGDIPPMPTGNQFQASPPPLEGGPERSQSFQRRSPPGLGGGPPMPGPGLPSGPAPYRPPQSAPPPNTNPDSLPSHPVPVRPGHMPNSIVNLQDKPPPVRNYGGPPQAAPPAMMPRGPGPGPSQGFGPGPGAAPGPAPAQIDIPPPPTKPVEPPVTHEELEQLRAMVKNNPNDQASALRLAKRLVEASDTLVPNLDPRSRARSREKYLTDAHKILRKLEKQANPDAMFFLADCLGRGMFGSEPDNSHAFSLYQSAAKLGHAAAAYRTAVCCEIGNDEGGGTRKDPLKAVQWYKRAATLGDTPAMYKVGMILLKGLLGQPRNPKEATNWLRRAADRADVENPHALHELGLLYENPGPENDQIIKDEEYAFRLFKQAAELGYKFSQFRMGAAYEYGLLGCPIDPRASITWYSRAAMQEEHQSELALAGWYLTGSEGVLQPSNTEAYLWARKAASAGLAKAEYAMGYFTEEGIGVPENLEDAKRWYWRAAAQDYPKARARLEQLKRQGKNAQRSGERISRSKIGKQQEGECAVM
ncbi:HCP-like protein, partial [Podospora aff. communis PSN243]